MYVTTDAKLASFSGHSSLVERSPAEFISNVDITVAGTQHQQLKQ